MSLRKKTTPVVICWEKDLADLKNNAIIIKMKKQFIKNNVLFARYGDLSPIVHTKYIKNKSNNKNSDPEEWDYHIGYHSPPCRKGIYAFVYPYIEKFLLSAPSFSGIHSTHPKVTFMKDQNGKKIVFQTEKIYEKTSSMLGDLNLESLVDPLQQSEIKKFLNKQGFWLKDIFLAEDKDNFSYLVKRIKPKVFEHTGPLWHHLGEFLESRGSIIEQRGAWVKTEFLDYKLALRKALGGANRTNFRPWNYSWDRLEVFIEKV